QFPELVSILCDSDHFIYILELYLQDLLKSQDLLKRQAAPKKTREHFSLHLVSMSNSKSLEAELFTVKDAFEKWLSQAATDEENALAYKLYSICKKVLFKKQEQRYGKSRLLPLNINESD